MVNLLENAWLAVWGNSMSMLILDRDEAALVQEKRHALGQDQHDEVWDEEVVIMPLTNDEHQELVNELSLMAHFLYGRPCPHRIRPGVNISDRAFNWKANFRSPDFVIYLQGNPAINYDTFWHGGPDFLIEIVSADDRAREKLPFYASINTREVLIMDRDPWCLELYQLQNGQLVNVGVSSLTQPTVLVSTVLPATFCLVPGTTRPGIEIHRTITGQPYLI